MPSPFGVIGGSATVLFADRVRSWVGATPSPAVKGRCGIRLNPEVAGTPAPGSALMSSLGLRPSLDCRHRCGRSAPSARWWTRRDKRRPTRHRPGDRQQRHGPAPRWCRRGRGRGGPGAVGSNVVSDRFIPGAAAFFTEGPRLLFHMPPDRPSSLHEPTNESPPGRLACRRQHQPSDRRVREEQRGERPAQRVHHSDHETDDEPGHERGPAITGPIDPFDRWGT
jgi:hypothetical protein